MLHINDKNMPEPELMRHAMNESATPGTEVKEHQTQWKKPRVHANPKDRKHLRQQLASSASPCKEKLEEEKRRKEDMFN